MTPADCPAYILAGGQSSRFGSDKALVAIHGQTQILRLTQTLQAAGHLVRVVADRADRYRHLDIECLVDAVPGGGPLAGLATAFDDRLVISGAGWLLLVNCDQAIWQPSWFAQLASAASDSSTAICFARPRDAKSVSDARPIFAQPLPGLFHTSLYAKTQSQLSTPDRSMQSLIGGELELTRCQLLSTTDDPQLGSFNTMEELREQLQKIRPEH